jgi:hypothetical protein
MTHNFLATIYVIVLILSSCKGECGLILFALDNLFLFLVIDRPDDDLE